MQITLGIRGEGGIPMSLKQALEMARCAEISIDRMITGTISEIPPLLVLIQCQIKECIKQLEESKEESNE